jgi:hypothetical protein
MCLCARVDAERHPILPNHGHSNHPHCLPACVCCASCSTKSKSLPHAKTESEYIRARLGMEAQECNNTHIGSNHRVPFRRASLFTFSLLPFVKRIYLFEMGGRRTHKRVSDEDLTRDTDLCEYLE